MYSLNVDAVILRNAGGKFPLAAYNALTFRVFDPSNPRKDDIGGVVAPSVDWNFAPHEAGVEVVGNQERR
jgi:hypothetical protein